VDEKLCAVPADAQEAETVRSRAVPMRMGVVVMAKVIEFYIPGSFRKKGPWIPPEQRGKVIEFPPTQKKSA